MNNIDRGKPHKSMLFGLCAQLKPMPLFDILSQYPIHQLVLFDPRQSFELVTRDVDGEHRATSTRYVGHVKLRWLKGFVELGVDLPFIIGHSNGVPPLGSERFDRGAQ